MGLLLLIVEKAGGIFCGVGIYSICAILSVRMVRTSERGFEFKGNPDADTAHERV